MCSGQPQWFRFLPPHRKCGWYYRALTSARKNFVIMVESNDAKGRKQDVNWLKHAFAIDSPEQIKPNETQRALVEKLCAEVVRRRLTAPALLMLEMSRPLNYVSAQFLHFLQPFATVLADKNEYENLTLFLEQRGSIDYVCGRIEALEAGANKPRDGNVRHRNSKDDMHKDLVRTKFA